MNLSDLESRWAPFLAPLTKRTRRPEILHQVHDEDSHSSTSAHEKFLQDIIIENIPIEGEEYSHPTAIAMSISVLVQDKIVIVKSLLVVTNESYFIKLTGRTETDILVDKVLVPNNLWGTPGMR